MGGSERGKLGPQVEFRGRRWVHRPEVLIVSRRIVLLDTSFILALENRDDPHHDRAKALDRQLQAEDAELLLHWGIVLEIGDGYARLGRRAKGLEILARFELEESYRLEPVSESLVQEALQLYRERPDKEWGLTDCVSFVLMQQEGITEALTADIHFRQAGFTALLLENP
jgi:predicted nucleic acid-binding protein